MGVICWGGIIRGKIFHKRGEIFGEALIDAVKLEKEAKYPRVLVKESVFNSARNGKRVDGAKKKENDYINSFLKPFADGIYFLDYFSPIMFRNISYISEMQKDRLTQLDYPDNLSKIIQTGLRNKDTHILDKYLWCLAKYRAFLNELFNSANDDNSLKEACGIQFTTDDIFNLSLQFHKDIFTILLNCLETIDFDNNNCCICLKIHHQIVEIEKWLKLNETKGETP
jgi:hypothetical protein